MTLFNYKYNNCSLEYFYSIFSSVMKKIGHLSMDLWLLS